MSEADETTVVIPNFNSGGLLRLCLASVTRTKGLRVVLVDNDSTDESREAGDAFSKRGLIDLVRREGAKNDGAPAHGAALDLGLSRVSTPFVFTLDSDAHVRREDWLSRYHEALRAAGPKAAVAGATKFEDGARLLRRILAWLKGMPISSRPEYLYVRPCHALYRAAVLQERKLSFAPTTGPDGVARTTGEDLFHKLQEAGH
ncbi:glycosyltransferase family 2 protein, partial [bacterium]|nr:glycosyltransferase family 2 protein [bacterium]